MSNQVGLDLAMKLRKMIHQQRLRLGPGDLEDTESAQVLQLFRTDVDRVRDGVSRWVRRTSEHPFTLLMLLVLAMSINWLVTLQCLIPLAFCWYLVHKQKIRTEDVTKLTQSRAESRTPPALGISTKNPPRPRLQHGEIRAGTIPKQPGQTSR